MGLFSRRRSGDQRCPACAVYHEELLWLREQNNLLQDRLLATAGVLQATREALDVARYQDRETTERSTTDETPETHTDEAEAQYAAEMEAIVSEGTPREVLQDVP